jgi:hypothetical protein
MDDDADADHPDVERGPLGVINRSDLRDATYRRWLWATRLLILFGLLAIAPLVDVVDVTAERTVENVVVGVVPMLPVALGFYSRAVMHWRFKAAAVGTNLSRYLDRSGRAEPADRIGSEKQSLFRAWLNVLIGTAGLPVPLFAPGVV